MAATASSGDKPLSEAELWLEADGDDRPGPGEAFLVDIDGFEGPLDLLLALARTQKVDLARISILALVEQYLLFIGEARRVRLELAADYLVMAAWLAFLKSKLLLPREASPTDETSGEDLAARLAFRLMRLNAMREAAGRLMTRKRLGRDLYQRGMPEGTRTIRESRHTATVYDLLKAYAELRQRTVKTVHTVKRRTVWSIKDARTRLEQLMGTSGGWVQLDFFIERYLPEPALSRTVMAASFGASLELAREGYMELRQSAPFAPIYMRRVGDGGRETREQIA